MRERVVGLLAGIRNTVLHGGNVARLWSSLGAAGYSGRPDDTSVGGDAASGCLLFVYRHHLGSAPGPPGPAGPGPAPALTRSPPAGADSGAPLRPLATPTLQQSQIPLSPVPRLTWEDHPRASLGLFVSARIGAQFMRLSPSNSFWSVLPAVFAFCSRVFRDTSHPLNPFLPVIFVIHMRVFSRKLGLTS